VAEVSALPAVAARPLGLLRWADAIGHCVLVFAFLPTLAALPLWLRFEWQNPLNASDPVVLAFLPVRGAILLLHAFQAGLVPGVLAGIVASLLACARAPRRGAAASRSASVGFGALAGGLAAATVVVGSIAWAAVRGRPVSAPLTTVAFELGSGVVCGMVAVGRALRLASGAAPASTP
jgi:hypothetical protein